MSVQVEASEAWGDHPPDTEGLLYAPAIEQWERRTEEMQAKSAEGHEPATFIGRVAVPVRNISIKTLEATKNYVISVIDEPAEHKKDIAAGTVIGVAGLLALSKALHTRRKK